MSITNELSNHVGTIESGLMKEALITPDRVLQLLDTRAKFRAGIPGEGFSFAHLRNTPDVQFYTGGDQLQATEFAPKTTRIKVPWANALSPVQFFGTDLNQMAGLTTRQMLREDYQLRNLADNQQIVLMDMLDNAATASASAIQSARVNQTWDRPGKYLSATADRLPMNLMDLFDPSTGLYGEPKKALGKFEEGHPWSGANKFGKSEDFLMTPRVWKLNDADGGGTATTNTSISTDSGFQRLFDCISRFSMVVSGTKVAICDVQTFSSLALKYAQNTGGNYPSGYPSRIGGDRWKIEVNSVQIQDTYFISDPNKAADNTIFVLHIGERDGRNGTVYPFYWVPDTTAGELMKRELDYMLRDVPDGLTWGPRRDIPFYMDEFSRFRTNADAIGSLVRLMWMLICTEPWCQLRIENVSN